MNEKLQNKSSFGRSGLVALAVFAAAFSVSCAGKVDTNLFRDGSARIVLRSEIPLPLASRIREFGKIPASTPLFDTATAKASMDARAGVKVETIESASKESMNATVFVDDLARMFAEGDIAESKLVSIAKDKGWTEIRVSLSRANAKSAFRLVPGIDKRLLDALSPPALDEDPVTPAEYRMNLENAVIGKKAMPSFDLAGIDISLKAPAAILASSGGQISGTTLNVRIKLFDLLTLEKPIEFWLRWKD